MSKKKNLSYNIINWYASVWSACMYVFLWPFWWRKNFTNFFQKKKIILPPLILNINNNKIITSVPVYEKCTSNNPPTTTLPPIKCLCRPKIDLFLVCFPNYYFPQKNLDLIQIRATSGPFVLTSGKDKKWLICSVKKI